MCHLCQPHSPLTHLSPDSNAGFRGSFGSRARPLPQDNPFTLRHLRPSSQSPTLSAAASGLNLTIGPWTASQHRTSSALPLASPPWLSTTLPTPTIPLTLDPAPFLAVLPLSVPCSLMVNTVHPLNSKVLGDREWVSLCLHHSAQCLVQSGHLKSIGGTDLN